MSQHQRWMVRAALVCIACIVLYGALAQPPLPPHPPTLAKNDLPLAFVQRAEKTYGDAVCTVVAVYDGDTFTATIADWPPIVGERISIRITGIDTPERTSKIAKLKELSMEARMFAVEKLRAATKIELKNIRRDKYFRLDADVYLDGVSLGQELLDHLLAKPYDGGTKPRWTSADYDKWLANKK